jgi:uncharacterized glyoxalase superfamily protein PhnB
MAITPYLLYEDVAGALKFLSKAFGFKKYGENYKSADGKINHAAMQLGKDMIMMGHPGPKFRSPKRLGQATFNLYVEIDDVDAHHAKAKTAGARIIEEPQDTFYGARRYGAEDPEGHQWYFAQELSRNAKKKRKS